MQTATVLNAVLNGRYGSHLLRKTSGRQGGRSALKLGELLLQHCGKAAARHHAIEPCARSQVRRSQPIRLLLQKFIPAPRDLRVDCRLVLIELHILENIIQLVD